MKNLLLLLVLGVLGYYVYQQWSAKAPPPLPREAPQPSSGVRAGNDFFIYARVRKMYREWRERMLNTPKRQYPGAGNEDLSILLTEIRDHLGKKPYQIYDAKSVEEVLLLALARPDPEMEIPPSQRQHVLAGIMDEAAKDGQKAGGSQPNAGQERSNNQGARASRP